MSFSVNGYIMLYKFISLLKHKGTLVEHWSQKLMERKIVVGYYLFSFSLLCSFLWIIKISSTFLAELLHFSLVQLFYKILASGAKVSSSTYFILLKNLLASGKWRKYIEVCEYSCEVSYYYLSYIGVGVYTPVSCSFRTIHI